MPSFDIVSEVDLHQLTNAVDQAGRIVGNRFDFKGVEASFEREERTATLPNDLVAVQAFVRSVSRLAR